MGELRIYMVAGVGSFSCGLQGDFTREMRKYGCEKCVWNGREIGKEIGFREYCGSAQAANYEGVYEPLALDAHFAKCLIERLVR